MSRKTNTKRGNKYYTIINEVLSGKGNTPVHRKLMRRDPAANDICEVDGVPSSLVHIVKDCSISVEKRKKILEEFEATDIQELMRQELDARRLDTIYDFVTENNLDI